MDDTISRQMAIDAVRDRMGKGETNIGDTFIKCFEMILNALPSAQPEPQWIPCSERLPNKPIRVQTQLDNEWIVTAYYYDNAWYTVPDLGQELKNDEVIAWMPLPKPWRG